MDRQQILDLYEWEDGVCFRHPGTGEMPTTRLATIHPRAGGDEGVRACPDCIIELEQERWAAANRDGLDYQPGHAGEALT